MRGYRYSKMQNSRVLSGHHLSTLAISWRALATALGAVILLATPVSGESEPTVSIGGQYRVLFNASNFDFHQKNFAKDEDSRSFWNQRFRTWLDVKADQRTSAYLELEIGHLPWGDGEFPKTYQGDQIGIETRRAFLRYRREDVSFQAGILGWSDGYGGILASADWDFSTGGVLISWRRPIFALLCGYLKLLDDGHRRADDNLFVLDGTWYPREGTEVGAHAYLKDVNIGAETRSYWVGTHVRHVIHHVTLNGFAILNRNERIGDDSTSTHSAFKLEAIGSTHGGIEPAIQVLVASGESESVHPSLRGFQTIAQSVGDGHGAQGYWSYMGLMSPRGSSDVNDLGIGVQNEGAGLTAIQARVRIPVTHGVSLYSAAGYHRATDAPAGRGSEMGTEVLMEGIFELSERLTLEAGAAAAFLGDYYESEANPDPDALYELFSRLQLEF